MDTIDRFATAYLTGDRAEMARIYKAADPVTQRELRAFQRGTEAADPVFADKGHDMDDEDHWLYCDSCQAAYRRRNALRHALAKRMSFSAVARGLSWQDADRIQYAYWDRIRGQS